MRMYFYLTFLFFSSLVLYLLGFKPAFFYLNQFNQNFFTILLETLKSQILAIVGISAIATVITYFNSSSNFSINYIILIVVAVILVNLFIIPSSFIFDQTMPSILKTTISALLNFSAAMAILEFIFK